MENKITLNKPISNEEAVFWNTLIQSIPVNQNTYISGRYGAWNFHLKEDSDQSLLKKRHLNYSEESNSLQELKDRLQKDPDTIPFYKELGKSLDIYQSLFPEFNPFQLMVITIYTSPIIETSIKVTNKEIKLLSNADRKRSEDVTYAPQIAMLLELMAGKMKEIDGSFPFEENGAEGSVKISIGDKNLATISVSKGKLDNTISKDRATYIALKEKNHIMEYVIDFSGVNTDYKGDILSPFDKEQILLTKELHRYNLQKDLKQTGIKTRKNKI